MERTLIGIEFANWLHQNWWVPCGTDFEWRQNESNSEYQLTIEELKNNRFSFYSADKLYEMYVAGKGEF